MKTKAGQLSKKIQRLCLIFVALTLIELAELKVLHDLWVHHLRQSCQVSCVVDTTKNHRISAGV